MIAFVLTFVAVVALGAWGFGALIVYFASWTAHREMVKSTCQKYGNGRFENFVVEFSKTKWEPRTQRWPESWFDKDSNSQVHAGIVQFNGKGMLIPFRDYWKVRAFIQRHKLAASSGEDWK